MCDAYIYFIWHNLLQILNMIDEHFGIIEMKNMSQDTQAMTKIIAIEQIYEYNWNDEQKYPSFASSTTFNVLFIIFVEHNDLVNWPDTYKTKNLSSKTSTFQTLLLNCCPDQSQLWIADFFIYVILLMWPLHSLVHPPNQTI